MAERVLVCGGRDFVDREGLFQTLDELVSREGVSLIIHGAGRGVDSVVAEWASLRDVPTDAYVAHWAVFGHVAGAIRDLEMLEMGKPTRVLAFSGGRETADLIGRAQFEGIPVTVIEDAADGPPINPSYHIYVDEAGTSAREPVTVVVAVTIPTAVRHAIDAELSRLFDEFVPASLREGFIFHATEIFHANENRELWVGDNRGHLLKGVNSIPKRFRLPIALGTARRDAHQGRPPNGMTAASFDHAGAFHSCIAAADLCLDKFAAPDEVGVLVIEDIREMRRFLRLMHEMAKTNPIFVSPQMFRQDVTDLSLETARGAFMRARRIVDQADFPGKDEEPLLQIADACAFAFRRWLTKGKYGDELMESMLNGILNVDNYDGPGSIRYFLPWIPIQPIDSPSSLMTADTKEP